MPITNQCSVCSNLFTSKKYGSHIPKYCSRECSNIGRNHRVQKECPNCGNTFIAKRNALAKGQGKFCSMRCGHEYRVAHPTADYEKRFWTKVKIKGPDDCWEYQGGKTKDGYGTYKAEKSVRAHRYSYELANGKITQPKMVVLHECDNPPCCNPKHLKLGTQVQNIEDMVAKKRHRCPEGEDHAHSKVTEEIVLAIRSEYTGKKGEQTALGKKYNITSSNVRYIVNRFTWKHI